ncbi:MAG: hypothetical protein HYZ54_08310 [Ignavibacteriae bacterium]|nr:hypothetical protein [Ignavibacteriota bacterium]
MVRLIFSCIGPIIGWLADTYSLSHAFLIAAVIFLVPGIASLFLLRKNAVVQTAI